MIDHLGLQTRQFDTMLAFYLTALAPIGYRKMAEYPGVAGLGKTDADLWLTGVEGQTGMIHLALAVDSRGEVDGFHAAALAAGGKDNGEPGLRPQYSPNYYAAFVIDPDGNNLEVVCHKAEED